MPSVSIPTAMVGADVAAGASTFAAASAADAVASFGTAAVVSSNIGASLASLGTIASIASAGVGALGAIKSGQAQKSSAEYNATIAADNAEIQKNNAVFAGQAGEEQAAMSGAKTRAQVGAIAANQAASGVDTNSGSALDVRSSARELGELDAINIRSNAARVAYGYNTQATSDTAQSQLDKYQASQDSNAGFFNAGTTILGGVGNASLNYSKYLQSE